MCEFMYIILQCLSADCFAVSYACMLQFFINSRQLAERLVSEVFYINVV